MKRYLLTIAFFLVTFYASAQDHMYSQFFNMPVYLNPALTGQFEGDLRMNAIYRNQWSNIGAGFNYYSASIDYKVPQFGGGIGLIFNRGTEGTAYLTKNNVAATYSYSVGSEDYVLSFGLQAGLTNRVIDFSKLVFNDQIDARTGYMPGSVSAAEAPLYGNRMFFDAGAGVNFVSGDFMIGTALQHLNRPDESFSGVVSRLPIRTTAHVSYLFNLSRGDVDVDERSSVVPSVVYYKEATSNSINVGMQYKRRGVNAGVWYRKSSGYDGPSALVLSFIFDLYINRDGGEKLRFGISHDASTTRLNYTNTSGTTEGSIGYETTLGNRNDTWGKFQGARRCYDFY
ncbi:PorP/SprF family type IX secretion system membrane protein [Mucilaginibacter ginkgonis]|uniref:PorP/SprF family type IX secretion system membrane protein n=1 Tax=Mucilaginibacter ginkgonis TaxID=2682091 RepID=A0A6I4I6Q8_9SPHI|nr:PorP/SprF family type IX secretion system membrane protein [Mucilaginibacter ginkgonis]QQL50897.1 PorP/SprF family type IX secretion system membrane protein [Mucilaginibacter ginkgonis]